MEKTALIEKYFSGDIKKKADALVAKYETNRAPLLEVLHLMQEHHDHITIETEAAVAAYLDLPPIDVREVMTFYTLYYTKPRAKKRLNICRTLSCALMGAKDLVEHAEKQCGVKAGLRNQSDEYAIQEVECLGACELAPMMQVNDDEYVGNLTREKMDEVIKK